MSKYKDFIDIEDKLAQSIYFDGDWYVNKYKLNIDAGKNAFDHFKEIGWANKLNPSAYFDFEWYNKKYPDISKSGADPLVHFLLKGLTERRSPTSYFKGEHILFEFQEAHNLLEKNKLFDSDWYISRYTDIRSNTSSPEKHYIFHGAIERRWPRGDFDVDFYVKHNPDVLKYKWNPALHYLMIGSFKGRSPHPLFDVNWYIKEYQIQAADISPYVDYILSKESRNPNYYFDTAWYREQAPEIERFPGGPLAHYITIGALEGRNPSPRFNTKNYISANIDVKSTKANPLSHFLLFGRNEGRSPNPETSRHTTKLFRVENPEYGPIQHVLQYENTSNNKIKIAVHLHLFYTEMSNELAQYIANIPVEFDLYISIPHPFDDQMLFNIAKIFETYIKTVNMIEVWSCENRGRDLAPLFVDMCDDVFKYDLICHLHSKKSPHNLAHADWRRFLLHHILGSSSIVESIIGLFDRNKRLGMLQPPYHGALRSQPNWGRNKEIVAALSSKIGLDVPPQECPDYPAGSFFWLRPESVKPLFDARFTRIDFPAEGGQVDGTFAHALERLLGLVPIFLQYEVKCFSVDVAHNLVDYYHPKRPYPGLYRDRHHDIELYLKEKSTSPQRKIACCTAIFGCFDKLLLPEHLDPEIDYFCVSDEELSDYGVFKIVKAEYLDPDPRRSARFVKTHLQRYFSTYEFIIWIDANVLPRESLMPYVDQLKASGKPFHAIAHPFRESCFEEAAKCREMGLDDDDAIAEQISRYVKINGLDKETLIETNFFIFDNKSANISSFFQIWWNEMNAFSRRDQISVNYSLISANVEWQQIFTERKSLRDSGRFALFEHGVNKWVGKSGVYENLSDIHAKNYPSTTYDNKIQLNVSDKSVDVIVCVHNALEDVRICLESVLADSFPRKKLIIVDDASDSETSSYLNYFKDKNTKTVYHRSEMRLGYTRSVNAGLLHSSNSSVLLLNSDTNLPRESITKMLRAAYMHDLGIVGPLSNAASFQSVPSFAGTAGQTAINLLPASVTHQQLDDFLEDHFGMQYAMTPLVHGFCMMIRPEVLAKVGLFDESSFPMGYGEENDYCFRAADAGFALGVTLDTYVYHAKSKSYKSEERVSLMEQGMENLVRKYSKRRIKAAVAFLQQNISLNKVRDLVKQKYYE